VQSPAMDALVRAPHLQGPFAISYGNCVLPMR
jgi:hypothetical protein